MLRNNSKKKQTVLQCPHPLPPTKKKISKVSSYPHAPPHPIFHTNNLSFWNPKKYWNSKMNYQKWPEPMFLWKYPSTLSQPAGPMPSSSALCSAFVYFPLGGIMILSTKFDSTDERYTISHLTGQVCSVIVQRTFCPSHIRYIFSLSGIHPLLILQSPLVDLSLSVACPLHMPYSCILCSPCTFTKTLIATETTFING